MEDSCPTVEEFCDLHTVECGALEASDSCDVLREEDCGVCADGGICDDGTCLEATCDDEVQNQDETDVDCGGSCPGCLLGQSCQEDSDCAQGQCEGDICVRARSSDGLIALYTFIEGDGGVVEERSGHPERLDLAFSGDVNWGDDCDCVRFDGGKLSHENPQRLYDAISGGSQTFTVEAWVRPANLSQSGPARIVSLSSGTGDRNFTLGQREEEIEIRFRHAESGSNGGPYLQADDAITEELEHYVVTFADGELRLYRNGVLLVNEPRSEDLSSWDDSYPLLVGNESTDDRPWRGHVYLVSIYERALSVDEVSDHFDVGP